MSPTGADVQLDGTSLALPVGPDGQPACRGETTPHFDVAQCSPSFPTITGFAVAGAPARRAPRGHCRHAHGGHGLGFQNYIGYAHPGAMFAF